MPFLAWYYRQGSNQSSVDKVLPATHHAPRRRMKPGWRLLLSICLLEGTHAFLTQCVTRSHDIPHRIRRNMVRNIDYPEAIILYGPDLSLYTHDLDLFLEECKDTETPVFAIGYDTSDDTSDDLLHPKLRFLHYRPSKHPPPNPHDIWQAIHSISIQPRPFGGSSGFAARQLLDPLRPPLPARVVVFGSSLVQTQAARCAGMRVIRIAGGNDESPDESLSDAVLDDFENLWLQDISTPGSFWLNPPQPRDDDGNRVCPEQVIQEYDDIYNSVKDAGESRPANLDSPTTFSAAVSDDALDEDALKAILADMAPL
jgi:hypothetical protein